MHDHLDVCTCEQTCLASENAKLDEYSNNMCAVHVIACVPTCTCTQQAKMQHRLHLQHFELVGLWIGLHQPKACSRDVAVIRKQEEELHFLSDMKVKLGHK